MKHVMIDLETLDTKQTAAFISIGAVRFDPDTGTYDKKTFYSRIDWSSAMKGRTVSASTLKWWMSQPDAARKEVLKDGDCLSNVLSSLSRWLGKDSIVWGNGSTFDISILENAYNHNIPWKFWNVRDVRTVVDMAEGIVDRNSIEFTGTPHHALDDAIHQAKYVSAMWMALRDKK